MRVAILALAGLALATGPVLAQQGASPAARPATCAASLQSTQNGAGYQLVRDCGKSPAGKGFALPRGTVDDGMAISEDGVGTVVISLFAVGAIVGGVVLATDGSPTSP